MAVILDSRPALRMTGVWYCFFIMPRFSTQLSARLIRFVQIGMILRLRSVSGFSTRNQEAASQALRAMLTPGDDAVLAT
jgi:hypothetical protein